MESSSKPAASSKVWVKTDRHMHHYRIALMRGSQEIGFAHFDHIADEGHLVDLQIIPDLRGQGFGNQLLKAVLDQAYVCVCEKVILEVRSKNKPALGLYGKYGFTQNGIRRKYYLDDGDDAVLMVKKLPKQTSKFLARF